MRQLTSRKAGCIVGHRKGIKGRKLKAWRRELEIPGLYYRRRAKGHAKWTRWWNNHLLGNFDYGGTIVSDVLPTGKGLIHKGRKP